MSTNNINKKIVVRIPPSPTGFFHIGRARTALFNYLFAKKNGGEIVFRIEDTDKERSKKEYEEDIIDCLKWLGITYDSGPFRQSERGEIYSKYIKTMLKNGSAYISEETEGANKEVIRFKNPNKIISFNDLIRGDISFDTKDLGDFVIARNINDPLYHLTVVIDDFEMKVTHVIRGEDGIANTPRQILIGEAIGATRPIYAHVPLILASDRSKMSARHGAVSLRDFKSSGYLPEAMINFMALLGFNPGGEREIYSLKELVEVFDLNKVQKGGAVFNTEKLDWLNKEYMKLMPKEERDKEIYNRLKNHKIGDLISKKAYSIIFEHISKWSDIDILLGAGKWNYFFKTPEYDHTLLSWKGKSSDQDIKKHLEWIKEKISGASDEIFDSTEKIKSLILDYATENGRGEVLWPLRVALSGQEKSPDPFTLIYILGKDETLMRITNAIKL